MENEEIAVLVYYPVLDRGCDLLSVVVDEDVMRGVVVAWWIGWDYWGRVDDWTGEASYDVSYIASDRCFGGWFC